MAKTKQHTKKIILNCFKNCLLFSLISLLNDLFEKNKTNFRNYL